MHKNHHTSSYWFPAKRYGYGWGLPTTWQGWLVFLLYLGLSTGGALLLRGADSLVLFVPFELVLTGIFVWIVWKKGEPPAWRWGAQKNSTDHQ
ncbi:hypothetical protein JWJ90_17875 [Desulfobulbus rhabdoformis]|uniref:hypothetical protein n=1 Tax=Desulfobulbus rhabdoformis TaxID=34032 RepID=UPI001965616B|nr:hypothetical protein [Desulfobulbus rhabdoformis]MBM9616141.1 hypothetical protein [Desulfobulbus rhabdoformis]